MIDKNNNDIWDKLICLIGSSITQNGSVLEIVKENYLLTIKTERFNLYFAYQKNQDYIETIIGHVSGEYGQSNRIMITPFLDLYLNENLDLYKESLKDYHEYTLAILSNKIQSFKFVKLMLESVGVKNLIANNFDQLPNYYKWCKENIDYIVFEINQITNPID